MFVAIFRYFMFTSTNRKANKSEDFCIFRGSISIVSEFRPSFIPQQISWRMIKTGLTWKDVWDREKRTREEIRNQSSCPGSSLKKYDRLTKSDYIGLSTTDFCYTSRAAFTDSPAISVSHTLVIFFRFVPFSLFFSLIRTKKVTK